MKRLLLTAVLAALAAPGVAGAHAILLQTSPANHATVSRSPREVVVTFDDAVRLGRGNAAVANDTGESVLGGAPAVVGHSVVLPLRPDLPHGDYSARWSIVAEDGHRQQGVLAFAVGAGTGSPTSVLGASAPLSWTDVALRALYLAGALTAAGVFSFWLLVRRLYADDLGGHISRLLFFALLAAFVGAGGLEHTATAGTRFALFAMVAAIIAAAGAAAAALAAARAKLLPVAGLCALALVVAPTFGGHALDRGSPAWVAVPVDLVHLGSAAVWIGGLVALLDRRARFCGAARPERRRSRSDRARLGQPGLVDLLRPRADHEDGAVPTLAGCRPGESSGAQPRERAVGADGADRAGGARRDRRGRRRAHRSAARQRGSAEGAEVGRRLLAAACARVCVLTPALSLLADQLEEARCILEGRQSARRPAVAACLGQPAAGRNRTGRAHDAAERERAQPSGPTTVVHATILRCG
jgi:copper transport protein